VFGVTNPFRSLENRPVGVSGSQLRAQVQAIDDRRGLLEHVTESCRRPCREPRGCGSIVGR
jgi:hypothetical protein